MRRVMRVPAQSRIVHKDLDAPYSRLLQIRFSNNVHIYFQKRG